MVSRLLCWEDKWNQWNLCSQRDFLAKQSGKGMERIQQTRVTAHQIWWHVLSTLPCHPRTGNQFLWRSLPDLCVPSVCRPQGQATPQSMAQLEMLLGPPSGSPGRDISLLKHLPSHTSPLFPTTSQGVSSHPSSQAGGTHKDHLDTEPVKAAPPCSVGSSGADSHSLCYHVGWCFLISYANPDSVWVSFICLKHWLSRR